MSSFDAATKLHNKIGKSAFSDDDEENCESHDHQMYSLTRFQSTKNFTKNFIERGSKITIPVLLFTFLLLLLIWDMKMTSTLSEIIHDDHADRWEPMDSDGLNRWFSPIDVCMLKLDQENVDIRTYRAKNCSNLEGEQRLFCGIGSSLGKSCLSPLSNRSFFTSRLIGILGDPDNKILKQSLRLLAVEKKAVVFIGDVISKQNQEAMVCELMRTDRITFTGGPHSSQDSTLSEFGIKWKDHPHLSLKIIFMHLAHLTGVHEIRRHRRLSPRNLEGETEEKTILNSRPEAKDNSSIYSQGGPSMTLITASSQLDTILQNYPAGIVVIANIGVWYNSREKYRKELPLFLRWLNNLGETNGNTVMFRETAAQHWNHTVNGYFTVEGNEAPLEDSSCVPIADSREDLDWRNRDAKFIIENEKLDNINVIPFRDVTAPLYDMHPDGPGTKDCTRFCQFPQMWQTVWWKLSAATNITVDRS